MRHYLFRRALDREAFFCLTSRYHRIQHRCVFCLDDEHSFKRKDDALLTEKRQSTRKENRLYDYHCKDVCTMHGAGNKLKDRSVSDQGLAYKERK